MNKKELTEIRKCVTKSTDTTLRSLHVCYVTADKQKVIEESQNFLLLPKEEFYKYLELFKKALTGGFGKTLFHVNMEDGEKEESLLNVMQGEDKKAISAYFDDIIENYNCSGNYLIIVGHGFYDYATRLSDGTLDEDAENVYEYMLTLMCPVELSAPGLSLKDNTIIDRIRDWIVKAPKDAFLFPTFTDRCSNVHEILYYSKNNKERQEELLEMVAGGDRPNSEVEDKEWFSESIKTDKETPCSFSVVKEFQEKTRELLIENPNDVELKKSASEVKMLLEDSGMTTEESDRFVEYHKSVQGERAEIALHNLTEIDKATIKGCDFNLKMDAEKLTDIETKYIDGRVCLVLPLTSSNLLINGIETNVKISD